MEYIVSRDDAKKRLDIYLKEKNEKLTRSYIKKLLEDGNILVNNKNEILSDTDLVGTGSIIRVKENDVVLREYEIILYGDVNGDGKINSVDLLVLQRHILEIEKFSGVFLKAGNIRKNGRNPSSVDLLLIQRHILGLQNIVQ